jgi:hypothetical protein
VVGQAGRHDLVSTAGLFGLGRDELAGNRTVSEALEARPLAMNDEQRVPGGRLVSQAVNLFSLRSLTWIPIEGGQLVLTLKAAQIFLEPSASGWTAVLVRRGASPSDLVADVSLERARAVAEANAHRTASRLRDPNAAWRQRPATAIQIDSLRRHGLRGLRPGLTAGEASDLITSKKKRPPGRAGTHSDDGKRARSRLRLRSKQSL